MIDQYAQKQGVIAMSEQSTSGTYQQGIVGTCVECAGQMVEVWRSSGGGRGILGLECQGCGEHPINCDWWEANTDTNHI